MSYTSLKELSGALARAFSRYRPTITEDVSDKGEAVTHVVIPHPTEPRYAAMVEAKENKGGSISCALWFGSVEIAHIIPTDDIVAAVTEIVEDRIVTAVHYKNRETYDDRHPSGWQKVFQITDDRDTDEGALETLMNRWRTPATFLDHLPVGHRTGVLEVARWSWVTVLEKK